MGNSTGQESKEGCGLGKDSEVRCIHVANNTAVYTDNTQYQHYQYLQSSTSSTSTSSPVPAVPVPEQYQQRKIPTAVYANCPTPIT